MGLINIGISTFNIHLIQTLITTSIQLTSQMWILLIKFGLGHILLLLINFDDYLNVSLVVFFIPYKTLYFNTLTKITNAKFVDLILSKIVVVFFIIFDHNLHVGMEIFVHPIQTSILEHLNPHCKNIFLFDLVLSKHATI